MAVYLAVAPEPASKMGTDVPLAAIDRNSGAGAISADESAIAKEVAVVDSAAELEAASDEELAMALQLEVIQDLDIIANLETLERLMATDEGAV